MFVFFFHQTKFFIIFSLIWYEIITFLSKLSVIFVTYGIFLWIFFAASRRNLWNFAYGIFSQKNSIIPLWKFPLKKTLSQRVGGLPPILLLSRVPDQECNLASHWFCSAVYTFSSIIIIARSALTFEVSKLESAKCVLLRPPSSGK